MKKTFSILLLWTLCLGVCAQHEHGSHWLKFQENKGQWRNDLHFLARSAPMDVFVGSNKFMLQLKNRDDFDLLHAAHHGEVHLPENFGVRFHNIEFSLIGAGTGTPLGEHELDDYVNYFLGNDSSQWAGGVRQFGEVRLAQVYPSIDLVLGSVGDHAKYEFQIRPGGHASAIRFRISGADDLWLEGGQLHMANTCDLLVDDRPVAWQFEEGVQRFVPCHYTLSGDTLGFALGTYNEDLPLILDPTLIFSTYTGSNPTDNWGSTATYDSVGNLFAGGIAINTLGGSLNGYPTTTGAFQTTWQGGAGSGLGTDIVITKFNSNGSALVYSTYLGGNNNEIPHSLVVNDNMQLYVLGTTSSNNFPMTSSAYDASFNGGAAIGTGTTGNNNSNSVGYPNGSDIIVTKFNANGTALLGSTYIGGTGNDGINMSDTLQKAYADEFRGEIIVDGNDNCFVATSTNSSNFPIVSGYQSAFGGGKTDGVVFKFNSSLSSLLWSTYLGGNNADGAYSLQFDPSGNVFVTGGTKSTNFPTTAGTIHPTYQGGVCDGWVAKLSSNGQTLMASTYLGTNLYDQSFFVQLDLSGNVYCIGQTLGNYPIGPSWVFSNANAGQFIHKLTNNLQTTVFSTRWGTGGNAINLSLSAFLVNECNHIFIAGWGGPLFGTGSATSSGGTTTTGLPTTSNAYQTTTDGRDMYFIVFEDSAKAILFASFFGGTGASGAEHVDGGTSRFDKKGIIYQAVCAGCGGGNAFPTTSGAYSTTNGSNNCNLGAIKYDLVTLIAEADLSGPLEVCINDSIQFENESFGGSIYDWNFGDGNSSDEFEPKHAYTAPGTYTVVLIAYDSVSCVYADTDSITLTVVDGPQAQVNSVPVVCPGTTIQLQASGGSAYEWIPINGLSNPNIANPTLTVTDNITYVAYVTDSCGTDTAHLHVRVFPDKTDAINDTALCKGLTGFLWASGGLSYSWDPGLFLSSTSSRTPLCAPDTTMHYTVSIIDSFNCTRVHDVTVFVEGFVPQVKAWGDTTVCQGQRVLLSASGTDNYHWFPETWVLDPNLNSTPAYPEASIVYYVTTFNSCGSASDSVVIVIRPIEVFADPDPVACLNDSVQLGASGARTYAWTGPEFDVPNRNQYPVIYPQESAWYYVEGANINGCTRLDSLFVRVIPRPELSILTDADTVSGLENVVLIASSTGEVHWTSTGYIPCATCDTIVVYPLQKTVYYVEATDSGFCPVTDSIEIQAITKIYAPNTFTPDGDGKNEIFRVYGHNVSDFSLHIYDRWGQVVYRSNDMESGWNGRKFNTGNPVQVGAYTYEIRYTALPDNEQVQIGRVLLIR